MDCPRCGYAMSDFDTECPRCARMDEQQQRMQPRPAEPARPPAQPISSPSPEQREATRLHSLGALIFAIFLLIVLLINGVASIFKRTSHPATQPRSAPQPVVLPRQVINPRDMPGDPTLTIQYLDRQLQISSPGATSTQTSLESEARQAAIIGLRVRWRGEVRDVCGTGSIVGVRLRCNPDVYTDDTYFDLPFAEGIQLSRGQFVTVDGTVQSHGTGGYELTNVRVIVPYLR